MLGTLYLLSCLGAVFCGGIGVSEPLLQYPLGYTAGVAPRSSVAYGNGAFLAKYGFSSPYSGATIAAPLTHAAVGEEVVSAPLAAHVDVAAPYAGIDAPYAGVPAPYAGVPAPYAAVPAPYAGVPAPYAGVVAARTAVAAPLAAVAAAPIAHAAVATPVAAVAPVAHAAIAAPVLPTVEHVPAVAQVPVTKYEAQPALIQNVVDVHKPKVATRKFEIRRPAIQKEFYDIEERIVVRPAGSAVVELEQPISKNQRGPTVVSPAFGAAAPVHPVLGAAPIRALPVAHSIHGHTFLPAIPSVPFLPGTAIQNPVAPISGINPIPSQPAGPSPSRPDLSGQPQFDDSESVSVENPEFSGARNAQTQQRQNIPDLRSFIEQAISQAEQRAQQEFQARARMQSQQQIMDQQQQQQSQQQQQPQQQQMQGRSQQASPMAPAPARENTEIRSRLGEIRINDITSSLARSSGPIEIPSVRNTPEIELSNQARLIALLTERGPVSEVRSANGLGPGVRARILSATPAPPQAAPQDEKVSTRRVVVSRPIQTVQEVDVVEPFTKIHRVAIHQPAFIKTARLGVANVPTSVPVHTYTHGHYAF